MTYHRPINLLANGLLKSYDIAKQFIMTRVENFKFKKYFLKKLGCERRSKDMSIMD